MSKIVQWKRGNANVSSSYTGAIGEITVNTDDWSLLIHDGVTPGGFKISNDTDANVTLGNLTITDQTILGTLADADINITPINASVVMNGVSVLASNLKLQDQSIIGTKANTGIVLSPNNSSVFLNSNLIVSNVAKVGYDSSNNWATFSTLPNSLADLQIFAGNSEASSAIYLWSNIQRMSFNTISNAFDFNFNGQLSATDFTASKNSPIGYSFYSEGQPLYSGFSHIAGPPDYIRIMHENIDYARFYSNYTMNLTGNLIISSTANLFSEFPNAFLQIYSNVNSYGQLVKQNKNSGELASTDFVVTADNGTDTTFYLDMGIAGSNHADPAFFGDITSNNDSYLYAVGYDQAGPSTGNIGNLIIGSTNGVIKFFVGNTAEANVVARITSNALVPGANVLYSLGSQTEQWKDLWVSNNTIYIDSIPLSIDANGNLTVNGNTVTGGASPVQPYIELTNKPFITLPAILGNSVAITAAPTGNNARFDVEIADIGAGPVINSLTVFTAGDGYTVGQRYRMLYYDIGGSTNADDIEFEVATINENGGITTIANAQFMGNATNSPGVYTNRVADYLPSVFDNIDTGLTLTRGRIQGIFNSNSEQQYNTNTYVSPLGTEWNSDGWGDLLNLNSRSYSSWRDALNNNVGNQIVGAELVMHDTINDKYYKFDFTAWGQGNGSYAYTRQLVTDPNYFRKEDYGDQVDIIVPDDGEGSGIGITRGDYNGIYNPYREEGWDEDVSPAGTLWNTDGWDDLSDVTTRTYDNFYAAYGNGGLGNKVPGSRAVMYVPDTGKYYAIEWFNWTQGGNGGGFSYSRKELNLNELNEGIKFADGTILKSAEGVGRVKATASGDRRIEEVSGNKTVSVTQRNTTNLNTVASRAGTNTLTIWIDSTASDIAAIIDSPNNYNDAYDFEFSLDDSTWYTWTGSTSFSGTERGYSIPSQVTYLQGDTVYFRYKTGGESVVWWDKADLPGGSANFRGAIIDYHAYSGEATWIGTIHIVDDTGNDLITHTEVNSGSTDAENDDLWIVQQEGQIRYRRIDGEAKTLKVQWIAKVFYGSEYYD